METNTVILGTEEYNRLRDFHYKLTNNEVAEMVGKYGYSYGYITESEALIKLGKELKEYKEFKGKECEQLNNKLKKYLDKYGILTEKATEPTPSMTIWQFLRWKKKQK